MKTTEQHNEKCVCNLFSVDEFKYFSWRNTLTDRKVDDNDCGVYGHLIDFHCNYDIYTWLDRLDGKLCSFLDLFPSVNEDDDFFKDCQHRFFLERHSFCRLPKNHKLIGVVSQPRFHDCEQSNDAFSSAVDGGISGLLERVVVARIEENDPVDYVIVQPRVFIITAMGKDYVNNHEYWTCKEGIFVFVTDGLSSAVSGVRVGKLPGDRDRRWSYVAGSCLNDVYLGYDNLECLELRPLVSVNRLDKRTLIKLYNVSLTKKINEIEFDVVYPSDLYSGHSLSDNMARVSYAILRNFILETGVSDTTIIGRSRNYGFQVPYVSTYDGYSRGDE